MRTVSAPGRSPVSSPGRWVWALAGLITAVALVFPGTRFIDSTWLRWQAEPPGTSASVHPTPTSAPGPFGTGSNLSAHPRPVSAP